MSNVISIIWQKCFSKKKKLFGRNAILESDELTWHGTNGKRIYLFIYFFLRNGKVMLLHLVDLVKLSIKILYEAKQLFII